MTKVDAPKKVNLWTKTEKEESKEKYGCEIVIENGSPNEVTTTNAPTDSYIVHYVHEDKDHYDLVRGTRVKIFDMYYDKFKSGLKSMIMVWVMLNQTYGVIEHRAKQKAKVVSKIPQKKSAKSFSRVGFLRKSNPLFRHQIFQTMC